MNTYERIFNFLIEGDKEAKLPAGLEKAAELGKGLTIRTPKKKKKK